MKLLEDLTKAEDAIYAHIGYDPSQTWRVFPISDCTDNYWRLIGSNLYRSPKREILELEDPEDYPEDSDNGDFLYSDELRKGILYRGSELTGACVDTHTDGNVFLEILDNIKEVIWTEKEQEEYK